MTLASCSLHSSDNGDLDGFWQLRTMELKATGEVLDIRESQVSWSFQGSILELRNILAADDYMDVICSFRHEGNELVVFDPYVSWREEGDIPIVDATPLHRYGIYQLEEHFKVLELNGDNMLLESQDVRLHFRRY